jgi:amino acid transporter
MSFTRVPKRILLGTPMRSDRLGDTLLPKRIALPIFASSSLSTVAYAPQEILLVLALGGTSFLAHGPWVGLAVVALIVVMVLSYRQTIRAYPSGGGDYEVAASNLGRSAGIVVGAGLLVGYVLTVAVSVAAGLDNLGAAIPWVAEHKVESAVVAIAALALINLRGVRAAGAALAIPAVAFVAGMLLLVFIGLIRAALGHDLRAPTADFDVVPDHTDIGAALAMLLILRAFSAGAAALTGLEAFVNGVPAFRPPKERNASRTLALVGTVGVTMFGGLILLAHLTDMRVAADPANNLLVDGRPVGDEYIQDPIVAQVASAVFGDGSPAFVFITAVTALILFLAANTAFNGFPLLSSVLARDGFLPRQFQQRGDRLTYSNAILALALTAGFMIYVFNGDASRLIQLYIVGVFLAFALGQAGMVRHFAQERRPGAWRAQIVHVAAFVLTTTVLLTTLITEFTDGAYIVLIAIPALFLLMRGIAGHYERLRAELTPIKGSVTLPSRIHGIVLVSKLHTPTLRALAFARATRPDTLVALTVQTSPETTADLLREWSEHDIEVPLTVLDSPYREVTRPVLEYVRNVRTSSPRDVVCVFVPEYVVGKWWEQLLHNQTPLRLKARLLFQPGVMVTSVPWQLGSAAGRDADDIRR